MLKMCIFFRMLTNYEKKIGLDKVMDMKRKPKKQLDVKKAKKSEVKVSKKIKLDEEDDVNYDGREPMEVVGTEEQVVNTEDGRLMSEDGVMVADEVDQNQSHEPHATADRLRWMESVLVRGSDTNFKQANWDFSKINFPNFGSSDTEVTVARPQVEFTPDLPELSECEYKFQRALCLNKKKQKRRDIREDEEKDRKLKFSCPEVMNGTPKTTSRCRNWADYKEHLKQTSGHDDSKDRFPELYSDGLQPLVALEKTNTTSEYDLFINVLYDIQVNVHLAYLFI